MATIKFELTVQDSKKAEIIDVLCEYYGFMSKIVTPNGIIDNPMTKIEFIRQEFAKTVKEIVKNQKIQSKVKVARDMALQESEDINIS